MRRREFITLLGAAAAWPTVARAQQPAMPVIGLLSGFSAASTSLKDAFLQGLKESGLIEGQNVAIEYRFAEGQYDRLPALAANLMNMRVAVIATMGDNAAVAAKAAQGPGASPIPIVFSLGDDPVALGLVDSLNRPGGKITGATSIGNSLGPKRLEFLRQFVPNVTAIAFLTDPKQASAFERRDIEDKARAFGWSVRVLAASSVSEIDLAFATLTSEQIGALIIANETFFFSESKRLASLAFSRGVPAIGPLRDFAEAGGLMSYGAIIPDVIRQAGIYTGRVLKGSKPADLPVVQPTRIQLIVNLKTARALGLAVPTALLLRADEVIE